MPRTKAEAAATATQVDARPAGGLELQDDLEWLLGRWKCVVRQYRVPQDGPLGPGSEDSLDYVNVYFPYADDRLRLALTEDPEDRPIAAEFLVRRVLDGQHFKDELAHMRPWGPVRIGKNRIRVGYYPLDDLEFRYWVERRGQLLWLVLESTRVHLELLKFSDDPGDIRESFARAPIKEFSEARLAGLKGRYDALKGRKLRPKAAPPLGSVLRRPAP
jgi:hypothetical protein